MCVYARTIIKTTAFLYMFFRSTIICKLEAATNQNFCSCMVYIYMQLAIIYIYIYTIYTVATMYKYNYIHKHTSKLFKKSFLYL